MCPLTGFRIVASIPFLRRWRITKIDVKNAFLHTGIASRDVYVDPPTESSDRKTYLWLLLTASYCLVNANAKWPVVSDQALLDIGFQTVTDLSQLFYLKDEAQVTTAVLIKIVDDFLVYGDKKVVDEAVDKLQ